MCLRAIAIAIIALTSHEHGAMSIVGNTNYSQLRSAAPRAHPADVRDARSQRILAVWLASQVGDISASHHLRLEILGELGNRGLAPAEWTPQPTKPVYQQADQVTMMDALTNRHQRRATGSR
jgi:hypothetical protein